MLGAIREEPFDRLREVTRADGQAELASTYEEANVPGNSSILARADYLEVVAARA